MNTAPGRWQLRDALKALYHGDVIAYPTEAVWGLGCDPFNAEAVDRLLALKKRPLHKGLILVASQAAQLGPLLDGISDTQQQLIGSATLSAQPSSARATTWLIPHHGAIPHWISGGRDTVAVRISTHPVVWALCEAYGGMIVSTSANPSALQPALTQLKARCYFGDGVQAYVAGRLGANSAPSIIKDLVTGDVLR